MKKKLFRERYYEEKIVSVEAFENKIEKPEVKVIKPAKKGRKKND
jgi:hypothetical protein